MTRTLFACLIALLSPGFCPAATYEVSLPLMNGRISTAQLQRALEYTLDLPPVAIDWLPAMDVGIDLRSINTWTLVRGVNSALGDGFHAAVTNRAFDIELDPAKLPADWAQSCDALIRFTQVAAPDAVARQNRRFGLHLPPNIDPQKPLVILIHGLDGDGACCNDLASLLQRDGFQTAILAYPAERPLSESAELLTQSMQAMHTQFPPLRVDLLTESMGGLIARQYIEGPRYTGEVDHLIMIAPPNSGSTWAPYSFILKLGVNASDWWNDRQWSPAWMINEGIVQSAHDLRPESKFLTQLNSQPRRAGVCYTIIAGDRPVRYRLTAKLLGWSGDLIPDRIAGYWGFRNVKGTIESGIHRLLAKTGDNDGPVNLTSARLQGVTDFVAIPADHVALYESVDGQPPAAWPTIKNRLGN